MENLRLNEEPLKDAILFSVRDDILIIIGKYGYIKTTTPEGKNVFLNASHVSEVRELLKRVTGKTFFHSGETDHYRTERWDSRLEKDEKIDWAEFNREHHLDQFVMNLDLDDY